MKKAAGLAIIYDNPLDPDYKDNGIRLLLVHPTDKPWMGAWSIPKGTVKKGENLLQAALRETREETGIRILRSWILKKDKPYKVAYFDTEGNVTKKIFYYYVLIDDLKLLRMFSFRVQKSRLQIDEVDRAGFIPMEEARLRIFKKLRPLLIQIERFKKRNWQI